MDNVRDPTAANGWTGVNHQRIGISDKNAANWARLAARNWTGYIADRAH